MNFTPSPDQANAIAAFKRFVANPEATIFALRGYAGTGKTTVNNELSKEMKGQVLMAAPTHKAINVVRRNLKSAGIRFMAGYDQSTFVPGTLITGTTAQLIGLQPVISDEQTEDKRTFGKASSGLLGRIAANVDWIVIDEVSMLSEDHLMMVEAAAIKAGAKLLIIGDPGQLPPVNATPIDWDAIPDGAVLSQVMRQEGDSAIPLLAQAIREGNDWSMVTGLGVTHSKNPGKDFLDAVGVPAVSEIDRDVYIAYTNRVVNEMQDLACMEVYGHNRSRFEPGQLVISESRLESEVMTYIPKYGRSYPRNQVAANNADELIIQSIGGPGQWGTEVELQRADDPDVTFSAEYLQPEDQGNPRHPYNVAVKQAFAAANDLQREWKAAGSKKDTMLDSNRKDAWVRAFELKDRTVIAFRHPFALTSHKSQGSTYRNVFVDAGDIERFDSRGLYVAATRPSKELVIG